VIGVFTLKDRIVLGYLKDLAEDHIDELVLGHEEGQSDKISSDFNVCLLVARELISANFPENGCL
jgi:hypothetical protein